VKAKSILIVDDDSNIRKTLADVLRANGYAPVAVATGKEALDRIEEKMPAVALIDLRLEDMSGLDLMREIGMCSPDTECIVITGHTSQASAIEAVNLGAHSYVQKPYDVEQLLLTIRRATEKWEAETALRESERRFRSLFETMAEGVVLIAPDGRIVRVNPAAERILGLGRSEIEGRDHVGPEWEALRSDGTPMPPEEMTAPRAMKEKRPVKDVVMGIKRPDGLISWVNVSAAPLINEAGQLEGIVGTFADITEHRWAEEVLSRYASEQAALYAVASAASTVLDPDELLSAVLDAVLPVLGTDVGWVVLPGPTLDEPPRIVAWRGIPASLVEAEAAAPLSAGPICAPLLASADVQTEPIPLGECPHLSPEVLTSANLLSHIGIPLSAGDEVLGILDVAWRVPHPYSESDRKLLMTIGQEVGLALHNAQLYQAARQVDRLRVLNTVSAAAVSSLELDTVLRQILELTGQALGASAGSILMSDPDTGGLVFVLTLTDERVSLRGHRLAPGQGIAGWVAQHGQAVRVSDVRQDPRWYDGVDVATDFETRSLLCAPLKHRDKITGVIEMVTKREGAFTDDDLSLLEAVSSIAAAALENARLYMATRAHANELVLLNEIGLALTSTLDFTMVVHAAMRQVQRLFQAEGVSLLQPDPWTGELHFVWTLVGVTPVETSIRLQSGEGIAGWALEHRQPVLVEDAQTDLRFSSHVDQQYLLNILGHTWPQSKSDRHIWCLRDAIPLHLGDQRVTISTLPQLTEKMRSTRGQPNARADGCPLADVRAGDRHHRSNQ